MRALGRRAATLVAVTLALGVGSARSAGAATLASGSLLSEDAATMICTVLNVGGTPVKVLSAKMIDGSGGNILGYNGCFKVTLQPGQQCGFVVTTQQGAGIFEIDAPNPHHHVVAGAHGTRPLVRGVCVSTGR